MARKPAALARELLRNFPKGRRGRGRRRKKDVSVEAGGNGAVPALETLPEAVESGDGAEASSEPDVTAPASEPPEVSERPATP
jgi:hypothetical protein